VGTFTTTYVKYVLAFTHSCYSLAALSPATEVALTIAATFLVQGVRSCFGQENQARCHEGAFSNEAAGETCMHKSFYVEYLVDSRALCESHFFLVSIIRNANTLLTLCRHSQAPTEPLRTGWLVKEGAVVKNWKRRFFVVRPDYKIAYYESEEAFKAGKTPKGTINPSGYYVVTNLKTKLGERLKEISERFSTSCHITVIGRVVHIAARVAHSKCLPH
jgi:hypothetical protein